MKVENVIVLLNNKRWSLSDENKKNNEALQNVLIQGESVVIEGNAQAIR